MEEGLVTLVYLKNIHNVLNILRLVGTFNTAYYLFVASINRT